jgi:hypothetical protein
VFFLCLRSADPLTILLQDAHRFHDADRAIRRRPIHLRGMPEFQLRLAVGLPEPSRSRGRSLRFCQPLGLISFEVHDPGQAPRFDGFYERFLQVQGIGHQEIEKTTS